MAWQLLEELKRRIEKTVRLYEIDDLKQEISTLLEYGDLTPEECDYLIYIKRKQLKIVLNLNLLPDRAFISRRLQQNYSQIPIKADFDEILEEEFEIIEQECINLNLGWVAYIQSNNK
ncbi:MAG: hypothetical protein L3K24_16300 [Gammaproteobacteria bacterium]|nr:hypothetical protein [Gammaproteobacteria bacterium]